MIPDIIRGPVSFLAEERSEEVAIFLIGAIAFLIFIKNEKRIAQQKKEKEMAQKKMNQTIKDLVESYSYIGEINRKMDILMGVALGISNNSVIDKKSEKEAYGSIVDAAMFIFKAESGSLRFVNMNTKQTEKEIKVPEDIFFRVSNGDLLAMEKNVNAKKIDENFIISSPQSFNEIKSYIILGGCDDKEEEKPKNLEILKLFATQAGFLNAYSQKSVCETRVEKKELEKNKSNN